MRLAYFISPHGFGHAARAAAVMAAVRERLPDSCFSVFTTVPGWFLEDSLEVTPTDPFLERVEYDVDLGLVQRDAFSEDLEATVRELERRLPFADAELDDLAAQLDARGVDLVLTDIAPLGIAAARRAGRPSILLENFTWDFIYRGYIDLRPELAAIADMMAETFAAATYHVQMEPFCSAMGGAHQVAPVSRRPRTPRAETRHLLGIPVQAPLVLVTMGGIEWNYDALATGQDDPGAPWMVIPGSGRREQSGRMLRLPHRSGFYHPDLIAAADVVVAKLGYSTVAEAWRSGVPLVYLERSGFRESPRLASFVDERLPSRRLAMVRLNDRSWLEEVRELMGVDRERIGITEEGAQQVADIVAGIFADATTPDDPPRSSRGPASVAPQPGAD